VYRAREKTTLRKRTALADSPQPTRWLILSHAFNMDGRAASQTITDKLPHLRGLGIEPVVVSSVLGSQDVQFEHHQVWPIGGAGLRFDLRHVIRRYIGIGWAYKLSIMLVTILLSPLILLEKLLFGLDSQASWSITAYLYSLYLIKKHNIKVVYSSGAAYSAHLAGYWLKRTIGISWIAEIHDPMIRLNELGAVDACRNAKFWAEMERRICHYADIAWWFTEGALAKGRLRHPQATAKLYCVMPGAEPPDMPLVQYVPNDRCVLAHFGSLSNTRSLKYFLMSFAVWARSHPDPAAQVTIQIYGAQLDAESEKIVVSEHLEQYIKVFGRIEYSDSLKLSGRQQVNMAMRQVDCLLLTHGDSDECSEYIPSKFYEYLWANRPQLMMIHANAQLAQLGNDYDFYVTPATQVDGIDASIQRVFEDWQARTLKFIKPSIKPIDVKTCTEQIVGWVRELESRQ
jgi:hypothetical protein